MPSRVRRFSVVESIDLEQQSWLQSDQLGQHLHHGPFNTAQIFLAPAATPQLVEIFGQCQERFSTPFALC
jgi:hypothetical protein